MLAATGRPISSWQAEPLEGPPPGLRFKVIVLEPPRDVLYAACDERLVEMVRAGALEEVAALQQAALDPGVPLLRALGFPAFQRYQAGELGLEEAIEEAQQSTRRYAKRQTTWFRHQIISDLVINAQYSKKFDTQIFPFIRQNLLTQSI